jgi:hypothetical protein
MNGSGAQSRTTAREIDARLLVGLRGPDLAASTAYLTLVGKMGFGDRLAALQRYDFFHFVIEAGAAPDAVVSALTATLARQSTFYNRNKHMYSLECRCPDGERTDGPSHADLVKRLGPIPGSQSPLQTGIDFDGKGEHKADIVNRTPVFLVEVSVQDDDSAGRNAVAARLTRELTTAVGGGFVKVRCPSRATVWWLAIRASGEQAAMETARQIAVTKRRDEGLLLNPNYQTAEFVSAGRVDRVLS